MAKFKVKLDFWIDDICEDNAEKEIENFVKESLDGTAWQAENIEIEMLE